MKEHERVGWILYTLLPAERRNANVTSYPPRERAPSRRSASPHPFKSRRHLGEDLPLSFELESLESVHGLLIHERNATLLVSLSFSLSIFLPACGLLYVRYKRIRFAVCSRHRRGFQLENELDRSFICSARCVFAEITIAGANFNNYTDVNLLDTIHQQDCRLVSRCGVTTVIFACSFLGIQIFLGTLK